MLAKKDVVMQLRSQKNLMTEVKPRYTQLWDPNLVLGK